MVEDHLVLKAPAGDMWKLTGLVGVQCVSGAIGLDVYVMCCGRVVGSTVG